MPKHVKKTKIGKNIPGKYTKQMQTSTYTFALMANALKLTLPPSAHTMLVQATNEQKARVFQKAVIKSLFKK